jgi:hypothetical protein
MVSGDMMLSEAGTGIHVGVGMYIGVEMYV